MDERLANPELEGGNEGSGVNADLRREEGPDPEEPTETTLGQEKQEKQDNMMVHRHRPNRWLKGWIGRRMQKRRPNG
jgi:hypothetical protein